MDRVRRSAYAWFRYVDSGVVDVAGVLQGRVAVSPVRELLAASALTGEEHPVTRAELDALEAIPADRWVELGDVSADAETVRALADKGLVVTDAESGRLVELRRREEQLQAEGWSPLAALFHALTGSRLTEDVADEVVPTAAEIERGIDAFVARHGPPPPHFHHVPGARSIDLPLADVDGALQETLARRRTTRSFDESRAVRFEDFATVLRSAFGCDGYVRLSRDLVTLRKRSPAGGALHAIEAYPLVSGVEGVEPGLYHYDVERHALTLLERLEQEEARRLTVEFTGGQSSFRAAHVAVVLSARFYRSFWKYRRSGRAYSVLLMDAGHLSQTAYLVSSDLGLGAFFTASIAAAAIDDRLGLGARGEGALAISGFGVPGPADPLDEPTPFVPRETVI